MFSNYVSLRKMFSEALSANTTPAWAFAAFLNQICLTLFILLSSYRCLGLKKKILMVWWFFANCPPSWEATWSQLHWRKRTPVVKYVSLRHTTPSVLRGRLHVKVIPIFGKAELWFGNSSRHEAVKISVKYVWSVCDDGSSKHETCEY